MSQTQEQAAQPLQIDVEELKGRTGRSLGNSAWRVITQRQVDGFAEATGDRQWIHTDPERAKSGPFGTTIAHGFMTLSLFPALLDEVVSVGGAGLVVNYGTNRVRFPAPVPVGARVRGRIDLAAAEEVAGGVQAEFRVTVEVENSPKPACVAEILFRYYRATPGEGAAGAERKS